MTPPGDDDDNDSDDDENECQSSQHAESVSRKLSRPMRKTSSKKKDIRQGQRTLVEPAGVSSQGKL